MILPLAMLSEGKEGIVVGVRAGRGLSRRLYELGFVRGERVKVLNAGPGPILVLVKGSRVAIGRGIAHKIFVLDGDERSLEWGEIR